MHPSATARERHTQREEKETVKETVKETRDGPSRPSIGYLLIQSPLFESAIRQPARSRLALCEPRTRSRPRLRLPIFFISPCRETCLTYNCPRHLYLLTESLDYCFRAYSQYSSVYPTDPIWNLDLGPRTSAVFPSRTSVWLLEKTPYDLNRYT